jgi:hypothetical protein
MVPSDRVGSASIQLWTLAYQTGRGDELAATVDKVFAASPALVVALIEVYWIGHDSVDALSWRHHVIAACWAAYAMAPPISPINVCA